MNVNCNCSDGRYNCGPTVASACVNYTGGKLNSLIFSAVPCSPNLNDIIHGLDNVLFSIETQLNLTNLQPCKLIFDPSTIQVNQLFQLILNRLAKLEERITCLEKDFKNFSIFTETINLDLSGLYGGVSCNTTNTYTVGQLLSILVTQLIQVKNQVNQ
jgi:hypothetical protein